MFASPQPKSGYCGRGGACVLGDEARRAEYGVATGNNIRQPANGANLSQVVDVVDETVFIQVGLALQRPMPGEILLGRV